MMIKILNIGISRLNIAGAIKSCESTLTQNKGGYVCFVNTHSLTESHRNSALEQTLNGSFLNVADGMPLVWTSYLKRRPIASRVCGPDFMKLFIERNRELSFGFIGGAPGQAERLKNRFNLSAHCYSPPMRPFSKEHAAEDWEKFVQGLGGEPIPKAIWVGLGAPKQELWMNAVSRLAPTTLFFGVGAAFDFLTGSKKRAPVWMQKAGLEWFFRLCQEPRRLWKRYIVNNCLYCLLVGIEILIEQVKE
ncbi:WecB/TagA/CpsF family glycosyltransferase [Bdellovibrionota bacterium FG-2]